MICLRFQNSEYIHLNQNKQRKQSIMDGCTEKCVKSILEAAKLLFLRMCLIGAHSENGRLGRLRICV